MRGGGEPRAYRLGMGCRAGPDQPSLERAAHEAGDELLLHKQVTHHGDGRGEEHDPEHLAVVGGVGAESLVDARSDGLALQRTQDEKRIEEVLDWRIVFHKRPIELA